MGVHTSILSVCEKHFTMITILLLSESAKHLRHLLISQALFDPDLSSDNSNYTSYHPSKFAGKCYCNNGTIKHKQDLVPTCSPMRVVRLGATWLILVERYSLNCLRYSARDTTRSANRSMLIRSMGEMSIPVGG